MKICLIGQNLTNLILTKVFTENNLSVDIYLNKKTKKIKTNKKKQKRSKEYKGIPRNTKEY